MRACVTERGTNRPYLVHTFQGRDCIVIAKQIARADLVAVLEAAAYASNGSSSSLVAAVAAAAAAAEQVVAAAQKAEAEKIPTARWVVMNGEGRMVEDAQDDHKVLLFSSRIAAARWAADTFAEIDDGFAVDEVSAKCWMDFKTEVPHKTVTDAEVFGSAQQHDDPLWAEYFNQTHLRNQSVRPSEEVDLTRKAKELLTEIETAKEESAAAAAESEDLEMTLMGVWTQCQVLAREIKSQETLLASKVSALFCCSARLRYTVKGPQCCHYSLFSINTTESKLEQLHES